MMNYTKAFTFSFCMLSILIFSQEKFPCSDMTSYRLVSKYHELKHTGLDRISSTENGRKKEIIPFVIKEILKDHGSKQLCIDTWHKNQDGWSEYKYNRFKRDFKQIRKSDYINNYDYLEMYYELVNMLMNAKNSQ